MYFSYPDGFRDAIENSIFFFVFLIGPQWFCWPISRMEWPMAHPWSHCWANYLENWMLKRRRKVAISFSFVSFMFHVTFIEVVECVWGHFPTSSYNNTSFVFTQPAFEPLRQGFKKTNLSQGLDVFRQVVEKGCQSVSSPNVIAIVSFLFF